MKWTALHSVIWARSGLIAKQVQSSRGRLCLRNANSPYKVRMNVQMIEQIRSDPYQNGWRIKIRSADLMFA